MDLCNIGHIKLLLNEHGFHFSKSMGQNFLIASWVPESIAEQSGITSSSAVLEIGPGIGTLTQQLSKRAGKVVAVELDKRLIPLLGKTLSECSNVETICADILKTDLKQLVSENFAGFEPCVCANLPYNITSPIISALIDCGCFNSMTLMIQREVAHRICALPASADYSAFTVYTNYYTTPEILFDVPPDCFIPQPKVTSSVIKLTRRSVPPAVPADEQLFFRIVKAGFAMRRKTLVNALASSFGVMLSKDTIALAIKSLGLSEQVRGEVLSIKQYAELSDMLQCEIKK